MDYAKGEYTMPEKPKLCKCGRAALTNSHKCLACMTPAERWEYAASQAP